MNKESMKSTPTFQVSSAIAGSAGNMLANCDRMNGEQVVYATALTGT